MLSQQTQAAALAGRAGGAHRRKAAGGSPGDRPASELASVAGPTETLTAVAVPGHPAAIDRAVLQAEQARPAAHELGCQEGEDRLRLQGRWGALGSQPPAHRKEG